MNFDRKKVFERKISLDFRIHHINIDTDVKRNFNGKPSPKTNPILTISKSPSKLPPTIPNLTSDEVVADPHQNPLSNAPTKCKKFLWCLIEIWQIEQFSFCFPLNSDRRGCFLSGTQRWIDTFIEWKKSALGNKARKKSFHWHGCCEHCEKTKHETQPWLRTWLWFG